MRKLIFAFILFTILSFTRTETYAQFDIKQGLTTHEGDIVPSLLVEVKYDNLPRLKYAWENYLSRKLEVKQDGLRVEKNPAIHMFSDGVVPTTSFTDYPIDLYSEFHEGDTSIQLKLFAERGNGKYLSPYENESAYREMEAFTADFLNTFVAKQRNQRMAELQFRIDFLQQEILKYQGQNAVWLKNLHAVEARIKEDEITKKELERKLKEHNKQLKQVMKSLKQEKKMLNKLLDDANEVPNTVTIPKN